MRCVNCRLRDKCGGRIGWICPEGDNGRILCKRVRGIIQVEEGEYEG